LAYDSKEVFSSPVLKNVPGGIAADEKDRECIRVAARRTTDVLGTDDPHYKPPVDQREY